MQVVLNVLPFISELGAMPGGGTDPSEHTLPVKGGESVGCSQIRRGLEFRALFECCSLLLGSET